jgi:hypothetical protein
MSNLLTKPPSETEYTHEPVGIVNWFFKSFNAIWGDSRIACRAAFDRGVKLIDPSVNALFGNGMNVLTLRPLVSG